MESINERYERRFLPKVHIYGRLAIFITFILAFIPGIYLSFVRGLHPGWTIILNGFVSGASVFFIFWFLEPISYFSILGTSGTYLSFLSGNTANMRIPAIVAAQSVVGAKSGTKKAEMAGILAMASSIVVNIFFLIILVVAGIKLISLMPQTLKTSFTYVLPGIYGAMLMSFALKNDRKTLLKALPMGVFCLVMPVPVYLRVPVSGVLALCASLVFAKTESKISIEEGA